MTRHNLCSQLLGPVRQVSELKTGDLCGELAGVLGGAWFFSYRQKLQTSQRCLLGCHGALSRVHSDRHCDRHLLHAGVRKGQIIGISSAKHVGFGVGGSHTVIARFSSQRRSKLFAQVVHCNHTPDL